MRSFFVRQTWSEIGSVSRRKKKKFKKVNEKISGNSAFGRVNIFGVLCAMFGNLSMAKKHNRAKRMQQKSDHLTVIFKGQVLRLPLSWKTHSEAEIGFPFFCSRHEKPIKARGDNKAVDVGNAKGINYS